MPAQVVTDVAELALDHRRALEVATERQLVSHAHAAVQLHGVLADEATGFGNRHLGRRHRHGTLARRFRQRQRRSEEHTSELQSLMRNSYAVFCLKQKTKSNYSETQQNVQPKDTTNL